MVVDREEVFLKKWARTVSQLRAQGKHPEIVLRLKTINYSHHKVIVQESYNVGDTKRKR